MHDAQDIMSSAASNYDVPRLFIGTALASLICVSSFFALPSLRPFSSTGVYYFSTLVLYTVLMFASSYVEEEHNFWYWATSGWFCYLFIYNVRKKQNTSTFHPAIIGLFVHRVIRRWNQTGQKFAGADDIVTSGIFHGNSSILLWLIIGVTYLDVTNRISNHIARSVVTSSSPVYKKQVDPQPSDQHRVAGVLTSLPLCATAFVFKLAFTAKDAPELTYGITTSLMAWVETLDLVGLARMVFGGITLVFAWVLFAEYQRSTRRAQHNVKGRGGTCCTISYETNVPG